MEKNLHDIFCPTLPWQRVRESWIRGYPDSRTVYKTQDFGPCPDGTLLCMEDKLGDPDIIFPSL